MSRKIDLPFDGKTELLRAGPKRLADAWELLEEPTRGPRDSGLHRRHLCGACYLAGYAVECILKVYIIGELGARRGTRVVRWSHVVQHYSTGVSLRGADSHSLPRLLKLTELRRGNWTRTTI